MSNVQCRQCEGTGVVTVTRSRWIGGTRNGYESRQTSEVRCDACKGRGKVEGEAEVIVSTITFGGHEIEAPYFTQAKYERAIARALIDELEIHYDATGAAIICHKGLTQGYRVTRSTCSCKAGECGQACKHRALYCFHVDVREPAIRKQWAEVGQANLDRGRKAVAA